MFAEKLTSERESQLAPVMTAHILNSPSLNVFLIKPHTAL